MSTNSFKSSKITNEETADIIKWVEAGLNYEQIASRLNRKPETIRKVVEDRLLMNLSEDAQSIKIAELDIKKSPEWRNLENQMTKDEQETFLYHWREIIGQFRNNVTHTEKLQIIDVIRNEILINRVLEKIKDTSTNIREMRDELRKEMELPPASRDQQTVINLQASIGDGNIAVGALNKEYKELSERKQSGMREIKGTRDQRVKRVEESKESITRWVASIMESQDLRTKLGHHLEKMKVAQKFEYERLSDYHKYEDGTVDQPLLNSETLKEDNY